MTDRATISMTEAWSLRIAADQHAELSPSDLLAIEELRDTVRREVAAALRPVVAELRARRVRRG